jgi:hypothetical protein
MQAREDVRGGSVFGDDDAAALARADTRRAARLG